MPKQWTIPVILRELRRVVLEIGGPDIMTEEAQGFFVQDMVVDLTKYHMNKEMEVPGQVTIFTDKYVNDGKEK